MSFINIILKFYIIVLIFRSIFTSQELYFNPFGKMVASLTEPIFSNLFKGKSKAVTDKYIPFMIIFIIFLQFLVNVLGNFSFASIILLDTILDNLSFLSVFFIISIILGAGIGIQTYYSIYFYRIGLPWIKFTRKFINIQDNRIVFPAIILMIFIYGVVIVGLNAILNFIYRGDLFLTGALVKFLSGSVNIIDSLLSYLFWLIVIRALISWVSPDPRNPFVQIVYSLTEPILAPFRRIIPPLGFLDLSAFVVLIIIEIIRNLLLRIYI
ncbi:YggT family protein [Calditerrivibrio nitroreducens]|uniref:YggT family protein n=1 Tax=Calditerrivibrio nitroreducens (strain DSM 19672 / NBRC 101217 / Yu37-1) TaxID=768670 RepID=E4TI92_CALNY|nr:YggT family protein [Calditerrivibrio nitroreducens]ADR19008.1 protein of unknown function YGGT [Calditerrivibrio nitroreducens DSM 19672]